MGFCNQNILLLYMEPQFFNDDDSINTEDYIQIPVEQLKVNGIYILYNDWTNVMMRARIIKKDENNIKYKDINNDYVDSLPIDDFKPDNDGVIHITAFRLKIVSTKTTTPLHSPRQLKRPPSKGGTKRRRNKKTRKSRRVF